MDLQIRRTATDMRHDQSVRTLIFLVHIPNCWKIGIDIRMIGYMAMTGTSDRFSIMWEV